jgi:cell division protein FtsI/penicillin-binding protein 2
MKRTSHGQRPRRHRRRMMVLQGLLWLGLGAVALRMQVVQQVFGPRLVSAADDAQIRTVTLQAPRGSLLDAHGNRLAYNLDAYWVDIHVRRFPNVDQLAAALAGPLGASQESVRQRLSVSSGWVRWPRPILEPQKQQIISAIRKLAPHDDIGRDVTFTKTQERIYPNGDFASNTLGYVDAQGRGQAGLELEYDSVLRGQDGKMQEMVEADGTPIVSTEKVITAPKPGYDVQLTIDSTIQGFVEHAMNNLVKQYHPDHAAIIVTNPKTGAILGIASRPSYDPNHYAAASAEALSNNWAVNTAFEPGSTFKVLVLAAALATGTVTLDDTFMSGHLTVAGHRINDWNGKGWGRITFRQALEYSSNVGFATLALKLGWDKLLHYMQVFGYLNKTGVDLPAEAGSIVFPPSERGQLQLATSGFGQGIAVTPIQQVAAIGAIANGGKLMKPYLAQAVLDPITGKPVRTFGPTVVNPQVVPPDVVRQVNDTLILDVSKGIDGQGYIPGYDVAGKTGTAQAVDPATGRYYSNRFIVSFIGYAPGWDPQVEVYVTVYWPKTAAGNQWGSTIATPIARDILKECLEYYHIPPRPTNETPPKTAPHDPPAITTRPHTAQYVETPSVVGMSLNEAKQRLTQLGLRVSASGSGTVQTQWPLAGIQVPKGSTLYLYAPVGHGNPVMPDLTGASLRDATNLLAAIGLAIEPSGDGYAVSQSVPPGAVVAPGTRVRVQFAPAAAMAAGSAAGGSGGGGANGGG